MTKKFVYADNAATTPVSENALKAMLPYFSESFGNPSAIYGYGLDAKLAVEESRRRIAKSIGAHNNEIFFTSGGTESDNWALWGTIEARQSKGRHIITTEIEHGAVFKTAKKLETQGFEVTYLPVNNLGQVEPETLDKAIRKDTILVSIMLANNEIGTVLDIKRLSQVAKVHKVTFHTDAVQAVGHIAVDVTKLGVDLLSMSAHKFGGPKGIGALYIKVGCPLPPMITGGGQEKGRRSGTSNVPGIVGMAAALEEAMADLDKNEKHVSAMRDKLIAGILKIPYAKLTGDPVNRLPGMASFVFEGFESEPIVSELNKAGICASSGSACSAGSGEPSRILKAAGYNDELAGASLRLSLSERNSDEDVEYILDRLPIILDILRAKKQNRVLNIP